MLLEVQAQKSDQCIHNILLHNPIYLYPSGLIFRLDVKFANFANPKKSFDMLLGEL